MRGRRYSLAAYSSLRFGTTRRGWGLSSILKSAFRTFIGVPLMPNPPTLNPLRHQFTPVDFARSIYSVRSHMRKPTYP